MKKFIVLPFNKKLNLLRSHSVSCEWPDLDHVNWCIHCGKSFNGHSVRVWQAKDGSLWLKCGTPQCDGSPIDWAPFPWWDPKNPETRRQLKQNNKAARKKRSGKVRKQGSNDIPF